MNSRGQNFRTVHARIPLAQCTLGNNLSLVNRKSPNPSTVCYKTDLSVMHTTGVCFVA